MRLATSIPHGTIKASLMLRTLRGCLSYNVLAVALRELGRSGRSLFIVDWLYGVGLHRRLHTGLNKGAARNALARTVVFNRPGGSATAASSGSANGSAC